MNQFINRKDIIPPRDGASRRSIPVETWKKLMTEKIREEIREWLLKEFQFIQLRETYLYHGTGYQFELPETFAYFSPSSVLCRAYLDNYSTNKSFIHKYAFRQINERIPILNLGERKEDVVSKLESLVDLHLTEEDIDIPLIVSGIHGWIAFEGDIGTVGVFEELMLAEPSTYLKFISREQISLDDDMDSHDVMTIVDEYKCCKREFQRK